MRPNCEEWRQHHINTHAEIRPYYITEQERWVSEMNFYVHAFLTRKFSLCSVLYTYKIWSELTWSYHMNILYIYDVKFFPQTWLWKRYFCKFLQNDKKNAVLIFWGPYNNWTIWEMFYQNTESATAKCEGVLECRMMAFKSNRKY